MRRRSGSPWTGLGTVVAKEMADHLGSVRMLVIAILVAVMALGVSYAIIDVLRTTVGADRFLFLNLFTLSRRPLPNFTVLLSFLVPLLAIAFGFDSINGEFSRRTLSRILAQPLYRDALLLGKFLAGLATLAVALVSLWLLSIGLGLLLLGLPPSGEEVLRMLGFLLATIAYAGVWLALAMVFSVVFRSAATAAMAALGVWLLFAVFWPMVTPFLAAIVGGPPSGPLGPNIPYMEAEHAIARISPNTLFGETALALLSPTTGQWEFAPVTYSQVLGLILGAPLPFWQSVLLVWPQITGLVAAMIVLFAIAYVTFQRQEIRA